MRRVKVRVLCSMLSASAVLGCDRAVPTQVMVQLDLQPELLAVAEAVEVRVFDGEGEERGRERVRIDETTAWPLRLPLVPEGGDASRTWLVEAAVRGERDAIVALARSRGGYERDALRSTLLCVYDDCESTACGLVETSCLIDAPCRTCEAGVCIEVPERAALVAGEGPLRCPRPMSDAAIDGARCDPTGPEITRERCGNAIDDDCDGFVDCLDPGCDQIGCDAEAGVCCDGACVDTTTSTASCGGCGLACAMGETCERIGDGAACSCATGGCAPSTRCVTLEGVARCDCDEATCGGDRTCLALDAEHHAYCGYP